MSYFIAEVLTGETTSSIIETSTSTINIIELEACVVDNINNLTIERYTDYNLEIINTLTITVDDLPNNIPMNKIIGNLNVDRIDGLDNYLTTIPIDGGTP